MEGTNFYEILYKKDLDCANSGDLSTILGLNNKIFRGFRPWTPLRNFRVNHHDKNVIVDEVIETIKKV